MRDIRRIFVHCTAGSQKQTLKDLSNEFKNKGWKNPGYHYVVFPNGKVEQLLPESEVSNGVQGYNSTSINVSYVGGINKQGGAVDNRTDEQKESLLTLLTQLKKKYPNAHIMGHRDIWGKNPKNWKKQCPCFDAEEEYAFLDTMKVEKYEDSTENIDQTAEPAHPEIYVYNNETDYTGLLDKHTPWKKTN